MKTSTTFKIALTALALVCGFAASAEIIMYNGFPRTKDATYFKGFTIDTPSSTMRPTGVSRMMKNDIKSSTLSFPACFDGKVQGLRGGEDDAALFVAGVTNGASIYTGEASGAKVLKLSDNCQSRTGSLHFRVLMKADQDALDAMTSSSTLLTVNNSQACGLLWTAPDYFTGAGTYSNLRLTGGLAVSATDNIENKSGLALNFVRGLLFSYCKDASGAVSLRLFVWGAEATALSEDKSITLVDSVTAGETYVCYAKIDIDAAGSLDIIRGMAQTVTDYDSTAAWPGSPFPSVITANLIGGTDVADLNANFVAFGANKQAGTVAIDEACLATTADDAVVFDAANAAQGAVIAYDGFPCGDGAYSNNEVQTTKMMALSTSAIYGFSDSKWQYSKVSKSTPVIFGAGNGLSLPSIYAAQGISATAGTSVGWKSSNSQSLMVYRTLTDGLLNLSEGAKLNMRFLMSVTKDALSFLATGSDTAGTLTEGTAGVKTNVNYVGAGLVSLPATAIEFNDTQAPALSPRDNSCLFAFVKGSDSKVGLYLNLRTTASGAQTSYKLTDVDETTGGTYLCFVTIEVGTGTDSAEKIRAFGVNVNDVTEQRIAQWAPQNASRTSAIECELISASSYPKHLAVGGSACKSSFKFDEFALSLGDWYPLVWAKYPRTGLAVMFR